MSAAFFWFPIAVLVGVLFVAAVAVLVVSLRRSRIPATSPEEAAELASLPPTPLQRRAGWGFAIAAAATAVAVVVVAREGPVAYFDDGVARLVVMGCMLVALVTHLFVLAPAGLASRSRRGLDERDRRVLATAPLIQTAASLVTVAAWSVALTEVYRGEGIPTGFMALIFWSVLFAQVLAHSGGVLFGYRLASHHAEG